MKYTKVPTDALVRHAVAFAREGVDSIDSYVHEDVEWSVDALLDYDHVEEDYTVRDDVEMFALRIHGEDTDTVSKRTSIGSRHHPPEYESREARIALTLTFVPEANHGLGETRLTVEQIESAFPDPDYEAQWRDI